MAIIKNPVTVTGGSGGEGVEVTNGVIQKCLAAEGVIEPGVFVESTDGGNTVSPATSDNIYGVTNTECTATKRGEVWVYG